MLLEQRDWGDGAGGASVGHDGCCVYVIDGR
jgi:hypothetical protein